MKNKTQTVYPNHKLIQLGCSLALALALLAIVMFMPITAETGPQPPVSNLLNIGPRFAAATVHAANGLTITKFAPATVTQGGIITYQLILTNNTGISVTDITVTDTVPADTTCDDISAPAPWFTSLATCQGVSRRAVWRLLDDPPPIGGVLAHGDSVILTYEVQVDQPLPDQTKIVNTANSYRVKVVSPTASFYDDFGTATVTTTVASPAWQIGKSVTPVSGVQPGDTLTYTITITNSGNATTNSSYTITDQLPTHTNFVTASPPGSFGAGAVTWVLNTALAKDETLSVTYALTVTTPLTNLTPIVNQTYSITGGNAISEAVGAPVTITVTSPATLTVSKTDNPNPVQAGDLLTYTLIVTVDNGSKGPASTLVVTDSLPTNAVFVGAGISGGDTATVSAPPAGATGVVTWTVTNPDPVPVGRAVNLTVTVRVTSPLPNNTIITNTYGATASNALSAVTGAAVTTTVESSPNITLTKTANPSSVSSNQPVNYTVTLTNTGNETAVNIPYTDTLPADFTPTSANGTTTVPGRDINGTPGVISFTIVATSGFNAGSFPNFITTTVNGTDIAIGPVATVTVVPQIFTATKSSSTNAIVPGQPFTYTVVITNQSSSPQTAIITETYPAQVTFNGATPSPDVGNNIWNSISLPAGPGTSTAITITVTASLPLTDGLVITNTVNVQPASGGSPVTATLANTVSSTPTLEVIKTASPNPAVAGEALTYTIQYSNTGTAIAHNVWVTDTLPVSVSFDSATPSPDASNGNQRGWLVGTLSPTDGVQTIQVNVTVTAPITSGLQMVNQVDITGTNQAATKVTSNTYQLTTTIVSTPTFHIVKTDRPDPVAVGGILTYTITVSNDGTSTANGVVVTDVLDSRVSFNGATGGGIHNSGVVTWNIGTLPATGVTQTVQLSVTVLSTVTNGSQLLNDVTVGHTQTSATATTAITTLVQAPVITVTKRVSSTGYAGETLDYTINFTNTGPITAAQLLITDTLPLSITNIVSGSSGASFQSAAPPVYTWLATNLPPGGGSGTITISGQVITAPWSGLSAIINNVAAAATGSSVTYTIAITGGPGRPDTPVLTPTTPVSVCGTSLISATVFDAYGNRVRPGEQVYFFSAPVGGGPNTTLPANPHTVGSNGLVTTTLTWDSVGGNADGSGDVQVSIDFDTSLPRVTSTTVTFTAPGAASNLALVVVPNPVTASNTSLVTATLTDCLGNPVAGEPITLTHSGVGALVPPTTGNTNTGGVFTTTFSAGLITGTATITADHGNSALQQSQPVTVTGGVKFEFTKTANYPSGTLISAGQTVTYTVTVTNNGTLATGFVLTDPVPTNGTLVPGSASASPWANLSGPSPFVITATNFSGGGQVLTFTFAVQMGSTGNLTNTATIDSGQTVQDSRTITHPLGVPNFEIFKTANPLPGTPVSAGQRVTYTVRITNNGSLAATYRMTDTLNSATTSFVPGSATASGTVANKSVAFVDPNIIATATNFGPGETLNISFAVNAIVGSTVITNQATDSTGQTSNSTSHPVITGNPALTITKTANPVSGSTVSPGETIVYTVRVTNSGNVILNNVVLTDTLPADVGYVTSSRSTNGGGTLGGPFFSGNDVGFSLSSLSPGNWLQATIEVTVTTGTSGTLLTNSALANSTETPAAVNSNITSHRVVTSTGNIYLPLILRNGSGTVACADLQITGIQLLGTNVVSLTVKNNGTCPTDSNFWVDIYGDIQGTEPKNLVGVTADRRWTSTSVNATYGLGWEVPALGAGATRLLTTDGSNGGLAPTAPDQNWPPPTGTTVIGYADSFDSNDANNKTFVEIPETNESNNQSSSSVTIAGGLSQSSEPPSPAPARPDIR